MYNPEISFEERVQLLISEITLEEKISQMTHDAAPIERLGATFDRELIYTIFTAASDEARAKFRISQEMENYAQYAGLTFWNPNVNIFRDPRYRKAEVVPGKYRVHIGNASPGERSEELGASLVSASFEVK